jgi:hypothetical protein
MDVLVAACNSVRQGPNLFTSQSLAVAGQPSLYPLMPIACGLGAVHLAEKSLHHRWLAGCHLG